MENTWIFVVSSLLLAGPLSGRETNLTSGCLWDNAYSLRCTSAGIMDLHDIGQESKKLPSWPRSPRLLKTIKNINLSNNMMTSLHLDFLYKFSSLETLNISDNYISMVSINNDQEGKDVIMAYLHTLVMKRNRLTFVPRGLGKLPSLQTLHLSANNILRIQKDDFTNCTQLQTLDLGDNRIHKINPDAFRDLRNLQVLRLSNNALVSITPLVFLYSHVLRADIDLSHNRWACDCRILPMKLLLTSLPVNMKREWHVTCSTPLSRTGNHLLAIDHINGSCQSPADKYIYARRITTPKGQTTHLPCNIKNGLKKAFWWTPQGIISGEPYIDRMNDLILTEPDHSHEGLYICIADMDRIVYQVHLEEDAIKTLIRRPRDVQPWNTKIWTEEDFSRAVALSVVITFICAFILGVFLRPCLKRLWIKLCKSKDSKKTTSTEAYDNEAFSEENVSRGNSSNGPGSNLPVHGGDADIEDSEGAKYVNVTYNEREIYFKNEQTPTHSELQERGDIYDDVEADIENAKATNPKRVTWAVDEESSPKVNLKHATSLLKPIHFIVPETQMENTNIPDQSITHSGRKPENVHSDTSIPKENRGSLSDTSSDESEFWDPEDLLSDEDFPTQQEINSPKVNLKHVMSLIKPINIIVPEVSAYEIVKSPTKKQIFPIVSPRIPTYKKEHGQGAGLSRAPESISKKPFYQISSPGGTDDSQSYHSSASDDGSIDFDYDDDDNSSGDTITLKTVLLPTKQVPQETNTDTTTWEKVENTTPTVNLKHVMSLIKPIHITIPELTIIDQVKRPSQIQFIPTSVPYNKTSTPLIHDREEPKFIDSCSSDDGAEFDYDISDEDIQPHPGLPPAMQATVTSSIDTRPTVNLQQVISLLKPINFIVPNSEYRIAEGNHQSPEPHSPHLKHENICISSTRPTIDMEDKPTSLDSSSSDDDSKGDHSSNLGIIIPPVSLTKQPTWTKQQKDSPTVNLRHVISLIKPINITFPEYTKINLENSPQTQAGSLSTYPEYRMEDIDMKLSGEPEKKPYNSESYNKSPTVPVIRGAGKKTMYDSSSSDDDVEVTLKPSLPLTKQTSWTSDIDTRLTVNLRQVMSLLKPINIVVPKFENRMEEEDNLLILHQEPVIQSPNPKYENNLVPSSRTTNDTEGRLISSDSSSSDDEPKEDYSPDKGSTEQESWTKQQNVIPTVNLKHVMSLIKPISVTTPPIIITIPESPKTVLVQSPPPTEPSTNQSYSKNPILPVYDAEEEKTFYDSSSSDDTIKNSSDVEVTVNPDLLLSKQPSWTGKGNESPKVNLKQVISMLKPIRIIAPDHSVIEPVGSPIQNQFFPIGNTSYEVGESKLSAIPSNDNEGNQPYYDSSSSEDGSQEDEDHSSDEVSIKSHDLLIVQPSWTREGLESPKVNLQQTISLLKPIKIIAPDYSVIEPIGSPLQNQFVPVGSTNYEAESSSSEDESMEDEDHSSDEVSIKSHDLLITEQPSWTREGTESPKVNLQQVISLLKPIRIMAPDYSVVEPVGSPLQNQFFPIGSIKNESESSSSEDESMEDEDHSSGEGSIKSYDLLIAEETLWTRKGTESPKMNLQQTISLLKPIKIIAPDYSVIEPVGSPLHDQFFPIGSTNYEAESSSSEDESMEDEDHSSDGGSIKSYDLVMAMQTTRRPEEKESPTLVRPISIIVPQYMASDNLQSTIQKKFFPSGLPKEPDIKIEDIQLSGGPEHKPHHTKNETPEIVSIPTERKESIQRYESSSSEDESKKDHSSAKGGVMHSYLPTIKPGTWPSKEVGRLSVNLKHLTSLVKPINIVSSDPMADLKIYRPHYHQYIKEYGGAETQQDPSYGEHHSEILTRPTKHEDEIIYDSTSSDDGSDMGEDNHSDEVGLVNPNTRPNTENVNTNVNLKSAMSLVKPIGIKVPDSTVTEALRRFKEKYNIQVRGHQTLNQLQDTFEDPSVDKLNAPKTIQDDVSKHFVYGMGQDSDGTKAKPKLLTWEYNENSSHKVNLKDAMSLLKPINIIAPDSIVAGKSPEQKYLIDVYQPGDKLEEGNRYHHHHDHDNRIHKDPNSINSEVANTLYDRSFEDDSVDISFKDDIRNSAHLIPKLAPPISLEDTSPKLNLKQVSSLLKPISIAVPDSTSPEPLESCTKELVAERLSHNTISEYYTDTLNDSSSDDGSFFSFSQSNSLSDDSEKINMARGKVWGLKKEMDKGGKKGRVYPNPHATQRDEGLKDFAGGGHEPNKVKDVLHWLNTNTNVEASHEFPTSKAISAQIPEHELVLDLNTQEWTQRSIVRKEPSIMPTYKTQTSGNKKYFLPDFGETSTEADLLDSKDSLRQMDINLQKVDSATDVHSRPKYQKSNTTNKKKVFDAFAETLKEESV